MPFDHVHLFKLSLRWSVALALLITEFILLGWYDWEGPSRYRMDTKTCTFYWVLSGDYAKFDLSDRQCQQINVGKSSVISVYLDAGTGELKRRREIESDIYVLIGMERNPYHRGYGASHENTLRELEGRKGRQFIAKSGEWVLINPTLRGWGGYACKPRSRYSLLALRVCRIPAQGRRCSYRFSCKNEMIKERLWLLS